MEFRIEEVRETVGTVEPADPGALQQTIAALARPRLTGSEGAAEVDAELRDRFRDLGYEVRDLPFEFSAWPGRFGFVALGVLFLAAFAGATASLLLRQPVIALAALLVPPLATYLALRYGGRATLELPWGRQAAANWLVHRRGGSPAYLIMAHRDSKSQPLPTLLRTAALVAAGAGWLALLLLAAGVLIVRAVPVALIWPAATLAGFGALGLALSWAANGSPGAVDNASGLAALLALAERCGDDPDVGFLVTDAEELGLAGARAVARRLPPMLGIVNLDTLDDDGDLLILERYGWPRHRGGAPQVATYLLAAARALEVPVRRRAVPFGVLVDHIPLGDAGLPAVTLARGSARTLMRVHRASDTADMLRGRGAADAVIVLDAALRLMRQSRNEHTRKTPAAAARRSGPESPPVRNRDEPDRT